MTSFQIRLLIAGMLMVPAVLFILWLIVMARAV